MTQRRSDWFLLLVAGPLLAGCSASKALMAPRHATVPPATLTNIWLAELPPPRQPVDVAIYRFSDLTGQFKPGQGTISYSRAVSQGAEALLAQALLAVGSGRWFRVLDRGALDHVLRERQVIREMRSQHGVQQPLPALRFAGVVFGGGIVGYDSDIVSAGGGLRLLGVGAHGEQRRDLVTVALSATSTQTGELLHSVTAQKAVTSVRVQGGVFRYIDPTTLLEAEAGAAYNEPGLIALQQAIELAVYRLVVEGAQRGLWAFADEDKARQVLQHYRFRIGTPALRPAVAGALTGGGS